MTRIHATAIVDARAELAPPANFPNSIVGLLPMLLDKLCELQLQTPRFFIRIDALVAAIFLCIHHLAVDVELVNDAE